MTVASSTPDDDSDAIRALKILESMPGFGWSADPTGQFTYVSPNALAFLGQTQEDLGTIEGDEFGWRSVVHPDDYGRVAARWRHCLRTGDPYDAEHRLRGADGVYRWFRNAGMASRDSSGHIVQWYGTTIDIEDQKRAEAALRDRERELSQLVDMVPVHIRRLTPQGEPVFFNRRFIDFFGLDVPDFKAPEGSRLAAVIQRLVHPDDAPDLLETVRRSVKTGEPYSKKYRMLRADGEYRWVDGRAEPVTDESGAVLQWFAISIDVDDGVRAEEALRAREQELSQLVDMVPSHVWRLTPEGEPIFFNKRMVDFIGFTVEDLVKPGMSRLDTLLETVHPEDAAGFGEELRRCLASGEDFAMRYRLRRADGEYHWMSSRAAPVRDDDGRIVQWYGLCHDIDDQMKAEQALRRSEAQVRRLVDSDIIGIVTWDLNGTLIDANDAFLRMLQYDRDELRAGLNWLAMTPPEWQEVHAREEAEELMATGKMQAREKEYFRKDGTRVPILIGGACFEGQPSQGVAFILDLTEQKRAEAALRNRERELVQLVDTVPVQIWCVSPGGDPAYINKTMMNYIGLELEDFDPQGGLPSAIYTIVHPDDRESLLQGLTHSFETGEPFELKFRNRRWDGEYRWTEGHADPLRDENGRIIRWYGANVDIHDHVVAQEALLERERFLWQLVETLPAMIDCSSPDGEPIYRSQQLREFLGYQLEELDSVGKSRLTGTLDAGVHPDDILGVKESYAHSLATGEPYARRHRLRRFDGEYRWVETRAAPMRDSTGAIVQWNVICLDIDAEVQTQEALRLSQDRLSRASQSASLAELSASIAHEVNQPLAAIVANSHACHRWLSATPPNLERVKLIVERIIRDANSAADVVSRIRALFKQSMDSRSSAAVAGVIAEARDLLAEEASRRGVRVEVDVEAGLPVVVIDRTQIQQVLVNLMRNGMEAMDSVASEKLLRIQADRNADGIRIEVSDRGHGLPNPESVFEPFVTTKPNGMGMGLAISRSIVESHGGHLWAESNEPQGSQFIFTLPTETKAVA